MNERGYMVTSKVIKKHWFRPDDIEVTITDGHSTITFLNTGIFTIETDKPLYEQLLYKGAQ